MTYKELTARLLAIVADTHDHAHHGSGLASVASLFEELDRDTLEHGFTILLGITSYAMDVVIATRDISIDEWIAGVAEILADDDDVDL